MKRLGLIGGVSPESTEIYVRHFHRIARAARGREASAGFVLWHLDYGVMIGHYRRRDWPRFIDEVVKAGEGLERAGCDALMIGSNTTHRAAAALAESVTIPVIHILDVLTAAMMRAGARRPLLLGTAVTMSGDYYIPALAERYDGEVIVPSDGAQAEIERIIIDELCVGEVKPASRAHLVDIIKEADGADGVILGCTELCMVLDEGSSPLPVFDTTRLHAEAGMAFAMEKAC